MTTKSLRLQIDDRTANLSDEAIFCRTHGHRWQDQAIGLKRFRELLALGHTESRRYCGNGCGSTWSQIWDVRTGEILATDRSYSKTEGYLLPAGSGRLHRNQARVAFFARTYPTYA